MKLLTHNFLTSKMFETCESWFSIGYSAEGNRLSTAHSEINMPKEVKEIKVDFNTEFVSRMIPKVDWDVLFTAAEAVGYSDDLPKTVSPQYENDEEFLRKAHHVLFEVEVITGDLVCPETGVKFPVSDGIPNMLANEDEV